MQEPSERDLRGGHAACAPELLQLIHYARIGPDCLRLEARQGMTVVICGVKYCIFVDAAPEETTVQRAIGNESDAQLPACVEHAVSLYKPVHKVILALYSREGAYGMCLADGLGADLAESPALHLPLAYELADGVGHILDGCVAVKSVLVEKGYRVEAESP